MQPSSETRGGERRPLIAPMPTASAAAVSPLHRAALLTLVVATCLATFWPTLDNGFLQLAFDDAIIVDTPALRGLGWSNVKTIFTEFNHAHYTPLTMLSLALDYRIWRLDPFGYHLTNVLLHAFTSCLACVFLWSIAPSVRCATLAALIFAVHPVQLEAVSLAIQRKTVLSGALFFLTLILYGRWQATGRRTAYAAALAAFLAAGLAKPIVVTLPVLLMLNDYVFGRGRPRIADKVPFFAVAAFVAAAAVAAHAAVGVTHAPHGGRPISHILMMARMMVEYLAALLLPVGLSPIYYYQRGSAFAPVNVVAAVGLTALAALVILRRREVPWTFFCAAWFATTLLPESNLVPLAQLRADRFLYLPLLGVALWTAIGVDRLPALVVSGRTWRLPTYVVGASAVALLAMRTHAAAPIWKSDATAWKRVAERHRWSAVAHLMLGRAYAGTGLEDAAEEAFAAAVRASKRVPEPHLELALLCQRRGRQSEAEGHARRFLELAPGDPRGKALLARLQTPQPHVFSPRGISGGQSARPDR